MCVNRIFEVLKTRGIENLRPSDDFLKEQNITLYQWNRWVRKKSDPELYQLEDIAALIGCSIDELIERKDAAA